jgi:hypothetical protein
LRQIEPHRLDVLFHRYRRILGGGNAEDVARIASIKAPPVSGANDRGGIDQLGDP